MTSSVKIEQALLAKLKQLPLEKQQEVLDFAEFLYQNITATQNLHTRTEDENTTETRSLTQRLAFIKLPLEERRRILAQQAEAMIAHYQQDTEWQELSTGDIIEY